MQWDDSDQAGFTTGTPWIAVNPNYKEINAKAETADPDSVFHYYKKLIALRKQTPIMVYGKYEPMLEDSEDLFVYTRTLEQEKHPLPFPKNLQAQMSLSPIWSLQAIRVRLPSGPTKHLYCGKNNSLIIQKSCLWQLFCMLSFYVTIHSHIKIIKQLLTSCA